MRSFDGGPVVARDTGAETEPQPEGLMHSVATTLGNIAVSLERIANHFDPPPPDKVDSGYIVKKLGCSKVHAARLAAEGRTPKSCIVPGTGQGKPWKFYRKQIDKWIDQR